MKKLLVVNDLLRGGGVEKLMHDIVWRFHDVYEITVLTYEYATEEEFYKLYPQNVKFLCRNPKGKETDAFYGIKRKCLRALVKYKMKKAAFDTVIAMKDGWVMQVVHDMNIADKLAWIHTDYKTYHYTKDFYKSDAEELEYMKCFRKVVCVSQTICDSIKEVLGDPGNLQVLYNPIDVNQILEKAQEPVVDIDVNKNGKVRFVAVGRQNMQKGYDLLLEACNILNHENLPFEVWVIGGDEGWGETQKLQELQAHLKAENVIFLGERKNPYKYMKYADFFLSTSRFEGFSYVSQEAAVLQLPMLLTECAGVKELLGEDGKYGIIMEISVYGISKHMRDAIMNPDIKDEYQAKLVELADSFDENKRWNKIQELIGE